MAKKKKRCAITSCGVVIKPEYTHCYMHRYCRARTLDGDPVENTIPTRYRKFYCDYCGTVFHLISQDDCHYCGRPTEEVG